MSMDGVRAIDTELMRLSSLGFEEPHCSGEDESALDDREMGTEGMSVGLRISFENNAMVFWQDKRNLKYVLERLSFEDWDTSLSFERISLSFEGISLSFEGIQGSALKGTQG